jgi:hypothetical protein
MQLGARGGVVVLAAVLAACQAAPPDGASEAITTAAPAAATPRDDRSAAGSVAPIDWAGAGDCFAQLRLLHAAAAGGRLEKAHAPPFAVVQVTPTTSLEWVRAPTVPLVADLPLDSYQDQGAAATAAPCLLLVQQPGDVRTAHRVIDFQNVASLYQSGVRSEKNPDYDAAQARVREAERESKEGGLGVLRVGDPMLDLIGLLVGGVIATFDHLGSDDDLDDTLAALKATPRSRDRPVYRAYEFERSTVRAGKEATIPIALRDLKRGRTWRTQLRQREMRQFAVVEGLDPRDRDYEQHRAGALSWEEFDHWQSQPPQLPMSALVAALVETGSDDGGAPPDGSELVADAVPVTPIAVAVDEASGAAPAAGLPLLAAIEPGGGGGAGARVGAERTRDPLALGSSEPGQSGPDDARADPTVFAAALDPRMASVVRLETGSYRGSGFYVEPRLVATTADLVGTASVIDVITSDGQKALGLVVHTDPARNLAVVHVPRSGQPAALAARPALAPGQAVDVLQLLGHDRARVTVAMLLQPGMGAGDGSGSGAGVELDLAGAPAPMGAPVFVNDRAVGLIADPGGGSRRSIVPVDALAALLRSEELAALR